MDIGQIIKDSLAYPFSDWKRFLFFGFLVMFTSLDYTFNSLGTGVVWKLYLSLFGGLFGLVFGLFAYGYQIRILKSSLAGFEELPGFNWFDMFVNGIKAFVVSVGYVLPVIVILVIGGLILAFAIGITGANLGTIFALILVFAVILYLIVIYPVFLMALTNMAFYDGELEAAFRLREILDKISNIGWGKLIVWYVVAIIVSLILIVIGGLIEVIFSLIMYKIIGVILCQLIIIPFVFIFIFRSAALFYLSESQRYLICENCEGYYQLQPGESPKDFEKCQCGGKLKYQKTPPKSSDDKSTKQKPKDKLKSIITNKRNITLIGILVLIIIILAIIPSQNLVVTNSTLIGTYNVSDLGQYPNGTIVNIPAGTQKIKIEYNLSYTPAKTGANAFSIEGYNTNVIGLNSIPIYSKAINLFKDYPNKNGTLQLDVTSIKSILLEENGVNGTIKIYAIQTKLAI